MRAPLVFFMFCVCATSTAVADDRAEISALYAEVARAIAAEDLAAITKLGYRSFDASDGEAANIWKANFQSVAEYGPVDFAIEDIANEDGAQWVTVTRKIFFRFEPQGAQQFEEGRSRDRWMRDGDTWRFAAREAG